MLVCFTANHRLSSFDVLESLAARDSGATETALRGIPGVTGAVVLSTCNRFEAYLDVADTVQGAGLRASVLETLSMDRNFEVRRVAVHALAEWQGRSWDQLAFLARQDPLLESLMREAAPSTTPAAAATLVPAP